MALEVAGSRATSTIRLLSCKFRAECGVKANRCGVLHIQIVWHYSWGDGDKPLFTSDREPIINQGKKVIKAQPGETMNFTGITWRNMRDGLLTGKKWLKDSCFTKIPPQHGWWLTKDRNLELTAQLASSRTNPGVSLRESSVCLSLFQAALLVGVCSRQPFLLI